MSEFARGKRIKGGRAVTTPQMQPNASGLSREDIVKAIRMLSEAEKTALVKIARAYARRTPYDHEDLIQETFTRVLSGQRTWPRDVPVLLFLGGVVRSIAWDWKNELHEKQPGDDVGIEERNAIAKLDQAKIIAIFDDDPIAQKIVTAMMEGSRGEELRALSALDKTEYESKRTKIRRRIEKLFL